MRTMLWRFIRGKCPRCGIGDIYERGMKMHPRCSSCGLVYEREPGYFLGSLYISYGFASLFLFAGLGLLYLVLPDWNLGVLMAMVGVCLLPIAPALTRFARILWLYFDRWAWPTRSDLPE